MTINKEALQLIKDFEGLELKAYQDSAGHWTIGYGTTAMAGVGITPKVGMKITEKEAEKYLLLGLEKFWEQISPYITTPINENEKGAYLSLAYNIGPHAFRGSSSLRHFNLGNTEEAANRILLWNKATVGGKKKVLRGLVRRREAEKKLFLKPVTEKSNIKPKTTFLDFIKTLFGIKNVS